MTWGVARESDPRMTPKCFGDFKTPQRRATEEQLRMYMREPSASRQGGLKQCQIVAIIAAPGTGKTRLLDDAVREPTEDFEHFMCLAIAFNGKTSHVCAHPLASRVLREFFCGPAGERADDALRAIDGELARRFPHDDRATVAHRVLDALEALYFSQRGVPCERSVLLIDEISQAQTKLQERLISEREIYDTVVTWVDAGQVGANPSRRGAVITSLGLIQGWTPRTSSGRDVKRLPLGIFNVWDEGMRLVLQAQAQEIWAEPRFALAPTPAQLPPQLPPHVLSLLASTGGRPREIVNVLRRLRDSGAPLDGLSIRNLLNALYVPPHEINGGFQRYLLASMLGIKFDATFIVVQAEHFTVFGLQASLPSLLNADAVAQRSAREVPAVALGHAGCLLEADSTLWQSVQALIDATVFCELDGSGKDFEHAWVLLTFTTLCLQFLVRDEADGVTYWPRPQPGVELGGPERPTSKRIKVFARGKSNEHRLAALFAMPDKRRTWQADGASINRTIKLDEKPTLALWANAWAADVQPGLARDVPLGWSMTLDVEWRPSTIVYFSDRQHQAIDFMLLVGQAGGTNKDEPHVYMFQCKALDKKLVPSNGLTQTVSLLRKNLTTLFSPQYAGNVLRRAGIESARQVTLCIAAIKLGVKIDLKALDTPFNIVLFDGADFRALGGAAFRNTQFFRNLE